MWTPAEVESLKNVVLGTLGALDGWEDTAQAFRREGNPDPSERIHWAEAMEQATLALNDANQCLAFMFNARNRIADGPREASVETAIRALDGAIEKLSKAEASLGELPDTPLKNNAVSVLVGAREKYSAVDTALGYLEWQPEGYPRSIGPHGDHDRGQFSMARIGRYGLGHLNWTLSRLWHPAVTPVFPEDAKASGAIVVRHHRNAFRPFIRAWGMDGGVLLDDDRAVIQADTDAGSGLRPFAFFQLIYQTELMMARRTGGDQVSDTVHSGRLIADGMPLHLTSASNAMFGKNTFIAKLIDANGADWIADQMMRVGKTVGAPDTGGRVAEWIGDLVDFWKDMDNAAASWIIFPDEIPAPPPPTESETKAVLEITKESEGRATVRALQVPKDE